MEYPDTTAQLVNCAAALVGLAITWATLAIRKHYAAKTETMLDDRAIDLAGQVLSDLTVQLAPTIAKDLADGKIDEKERAELLAQAEKYLGEAGLERLGKALGLDLGGVKDWLAMKLGAKASVMAQPEKLGAFMASPELSRKILGGK